MTIKSELIAESKYDLTPWQKKTILAVRLSAAKIFQYKRHINVSTRKLRYGGQSIDHMPNYICSTTHETILHPTRHELGFPTVKPYPSWIEQSYQFIRSSITNSLLLYQGILHDLGDSLPRLIPPREQFRTTPPSDITKKAFQHHTTSDSSEIANPELRSTGIWETSLWDLPHHELRSLSKLVEWTRCGACGGSCCLVCGWAEGEWERWSFDALCCVVEGVAMGRRGVVCWIPTDKAVGYMQCIPVFTVFSHFFLLLSFSPFD